MLELRTSQKSMVRTIVERPNLLLVSAMGSGKTVSTLVAVRQLVDSGEVRNVLIIAPKSVAFGVWPDENEQHGIGLNLRYCYRERDIVNFMAEQNCHHVCVCSVTMIAEIPHKGMHWDMVILDESTLFKHKSSARSKEARRLCNGVYRRLLLTGTPIHNGYENLWHQMFLLDGGKALGKSLTSFRVRYMYESHKISGVVTVYKVRPGMDEVILKDTAHLIYVADYDLELTGLMYKNIYVELPEKVYTSYIALDTIGVTRLDDTKLVAYSQSAEGAKLRQIASGQVIPTTENPKNAGYKVAHREKLNAVRDIASTASDGVLVAYQFKGELAELRKAFPDARTITCKEDIVAWNNGEIPVALVHPDSVGYGLNLQYGGCTVVWYTLTLNGELYAQLNKRLHRPGQTQPVTVVHILTRSTIDIPILKMLERKQAEADKFVTYGKE